MFTFAWKSLWRDRLRFGITVSGVALAVLLILVMNGLFASSGRQITAYIDRSEADLFVAQSGVRNMHMATSVLPLSVKAQVQAVAGVERVEAITYFPAMLEWQGESDQLYAIGISPDATMGGPWLMAEGQDRPRPGEIIISDRQRGPATPRIGERVRLGGRDLVVVGHSRETKSLASSLVFVNAEDAAAMRGPNRVNYLLVRTGSGSRPEDAREIERQVAGVTVLTRQQVSQADRDIALQMGVEILGMISLVGFVIGLAVVALTLYVATVEQIRQYGVLKALGAEATHLYGAILSQGLVAAVTGYSLGIVLTLLVGWLVPRWVPGLEIDLVPAHALRVFGLVLVMGAVAALPPFWRVQRVDPVSLFRP